MQLRRFGEIRPLAWASEWVCVVCGVAVEKGSGRRRHCSVNCQALASRWKNARPTEFTCHLCGRTQSLLRMSGSKLQRTDTKWCKECGRDSPKVKRFVLYGVTPERYAEAMASGCEICGRTDVPLHVDHDHSCCDQRGGSAATCGDCVRGFLCGSCNRAIGLLKDDITTLGRAIEYLSKSR
ncbi:endonuclease domain-containing protein [Gordonia malaquae]|uniref:endonuclease domain-containing protein n=1 Tax=Gordonia malaquae TaxID=410332 RepID=UPI003BF8FB82